MFSYALNKRTRKYAKIRIFAPANHLYPQCGNTHQINLLKLI